MTDLAPALDAYHNVLILEIERCKRIKAEARRAAEMLARDREARQRSLELATVRALELRQRAIGEIALRAIETEFGVEESR